MWLDQGYTVSGRQWIEDTLGWSVEIVQLPRTWERGFRGVMDPVTGFRLEYITIKGKRGFQGVLPRRGSWSGPSPGSCTAAAWRATTST